MAKFRKIKGVFNSNYRLIDTQNRIYNGKQYESHSDDFFKKARAVQRKKGLSQTDAVKMLHDAYSYSKIYSDIADSKDDYDKIKKLEAIEQEYREYDLFDEFDYVIEFVSDEY